MNDYDVRRDVSDKYSLRGRVFHKIRDDILNGKYHENEELKEIPIGQELGVSRTPVREALRQLELEGLVQIIPNRGAFVTGIQAKDVHDIYMIRSRIEGLAARWAAERMTDEELDAMREIVELQEFYAAKGDKLRVGNLDNRFHELLYESCRSNQLRRMLSIFHHHIYKARESSVRRGRALASTQEHRAILTALENHDPDEAERAMTVHVANARDSFFQLIAE